ncbi:hypothetical protein AVEN_54539-1 [Araneus ventricosus]|uniref:Transposable element Tc3 transposase n=1 Tax=Araneus ventricosus TaxID=182803 RepID=A0A4Y2L740_ARAVE|nr:hypothetical protein AVEN_54539-1 [Araneus ventricosus]
MIDVVSTLSNLTLSYNVTPRLFSSCKESWKALGLKSYGALTGNHLLLGMFYLRFRAPSRIEKEDLPLSDLWNVGFQHDGAPPHRVSSVQQYIRDTFQQQAIGYGGCVEWPPRSPDLNSLDFFLWGYIKQRMHAIPPPTLQELRNPITDACASVSIAMLYNVQWEVQSRYRCALLL